MSSDDTNIRRISYLLNMINRGKSEQSSDSSFESLSHPNISDNLETMLAVPPVAEDDYLCETTVSDKRVELMIRLIYESLVLLSSPDEVFDKPIDTDVHLKYVERYLDGPLPEPYYKLDSSHLWMIYWLLNAHVVLSGNDPLAELKLLVSEKINSLIIDDGRGGIAGGPGGQIGHAASTYANVLLLVLIEDYDTLERIKPNLAEWLFTLKHDNGSFAMHKDGECDTRSTYCALVVSSLLNIQTEALWAGTREWVTSCQTFEGGFAGVPETEAHGGYTFCAVASFFLLGRKKHDFDEESLLRWLAARQVSLAGGFSGRTNKLVDACYSFWVGGAFALMEADVQQPVFNKASLLTYIANCCQDLQHGGLKDKPDTSPDFYHTNYALCGLSMAEYYYKNDKGDAFSFLVDERVQGSSYTIPVSPVFGIPLRHVKKAKDHFAL